jgi:hypothetical protein
LVIHRPLAWLEYISGGERSHSTNAYLKAVHAVGAKVILKWHILCLILRSAYPGKWKKNHHHKEKMMKKALITMVIFLGVLCAAATSQAYFYALNITGGEVELSLNDDLSELSVVTTEDLIVGFSYDAPDANIPLAYTLSADLDLSLSLDLGPLSLGPFDYSLALDAEPIGVLDSIDPSDLIGDGTDATSFTGQTLISGDMGEYYLEDALLAYDILFTPVTGTDDEIDEYAITINALTLSDGNTQEFVSGLLDMVTDSMDLPISLSGPLTVSAELTGDLELEADAVPVPAAVWLLGSGILAILGLRRRSAV